MKETNSIVVLHFYPDTPVSYYRIVHYDLDIAIDLAYESLFPNGYKNSETN